MGGLDSKPGQLGGVLLNVPVRKLPIADAFLGGADDDLIVNVGEILNVVYIVAFELQISAQHVEYNGAEGMPNVAGGVGRDAAYVHLHLLPGGRKFLLHAGKCAVQSHWMASIRATAWAARPSPLPVKPIRSVVVALMLTFVLCVPRACDTFSRISSMKGPSRGR